MNKAPTPTLALLAGGLATRLHPLTQAKPKAMIDIAGEPFISRQLRLIAGQGVRRVVICTGFLSEQIENYVDEGVRFGLRVDYSHDGDRLLGTGGALRKALPLLGDEFLVMYGDSYLPTAFSPVISAFRTSGRLGLMTVYQNNGEWDASNVAFSKGEILIYDKKNASPEMRHIDFGLGMFQSHVFRRWPEGEPFDLSVVYQKLLAEGQLASYETADRFFEIGSSRGIQEMIQYFGAMEVLENA
jgi:NDP-sugar pyrophosphorylase family protein